MADASPVKWHLAHTTWFFETFVLEHHAARHEPFHPSFRYLFNSYYNALGEQYARPRRGLLTRPGLEEILRYRAHVDERMRALLGGKALPAEALATVELGLNHEQQHQELIVTDVLHLFSLNPLFPIYRKEQPEENARPESLQFIRFEAGDVEIGTTAQASHSTMNCRATASMSPLLNLRTARSATPSTSLSSRAAAIAGRNSGCQKAGRSRRRRAGRSRSTGARTTTAGRSSRATACSRSTPRTRSATSAISRPTPTRTGRVHACRRSSNGKSPRRRSSTAKSGNGPPAPTRPTPASARRRARSASTTASSCPTSTCCAAARRRHPADTCGAATGISFLLRRAGSSAAFGWPGTSTRRARAPGAGRQSGPRSTAPPIRRCSPWQATSRRVPSARRHPAKTSKRS